MRLLVVSNMYPGRQRASFGIFVADRVEAYRSAGCNVRVVANSDPRKGWRVPVKYFTLAIRAFAAGLVSRPDVVEAHYLHPTGAIAALTAWLGRAQLVIHAHGSDVDADGRPTFLERWAVGRAVEMHANSAATASALEARHPGKTTVVIPPGVVMGRFPTSAARRPAVVGFVGTLADYKGPDVLIEALAVLEGEWSALVIGDGPMRPHVSDLVGIHGLNDRVTMEGWIDPSALSERYRNMAVLAVPSRREAFGQVAVEALASGTPVVVSDVGGLSSIPDAESGAIVPTEDAAALAQELRTWLDKRDLEAPKRAARLRAESFAVELAAAQALERYRALVH